MTTVKRLWRATLAVCAVFALLALDPVQARAGFVSGVDVGNYIIVYQGGSSGAQLSINSFGTTGIWTGDIGIAGVGKLAATGPGTLNGNINFAAANSGQASISNTTINGTVNYGIPGVQTTMNALNALSSNLGAQAGSGTVLAINTNSDQTVLVSNGFLTGGNRLFSVSSVNTGNGENLIIKGDGSVGVVFDVNTPGEAQFHGNILLQDLSGKYFGTAGYAGLSPDQVLFNLYDGDKLSVNNNGNNAHPDNIIYGTFLNPDGEISFNNTRFVGRVFGGDSANMQIVSGDTITLPPTTAVPAPPSLLLALSGAIPLILLFVCRRRHVVTA
jgi:hypothetical protein